MNPKVFEARQIGPRSIVVMWGAVLWLAIFLHGWALVSCGFVIFILGRTIDGPLGRSKRWLLTGAGIILLSAMLLGQPDGFLLAMPYSVQGLKHGVEMIVRAMMVLLGTRFLTNHLSPATLTAVLEKRMPGLGIALGMAFNILAELTIRLKEILICFNQRRNGRFVLSDLKRFLVAVFIDVLSTADELAIAAQLRGLKNHSPKFALQRGAFDRRIIGCCSMVVLASIAMRLWLRV